MLFPPSVNKNGDLELPNELQFIRVFCLMIHYFLSCSFLTEYVPHGMYGHDLSCPEHVSLLSNPYSYFDYFFRILVDILSLYFHSASGLALYLQEYR